MRNRSQAAKVGWVTRRRRGKVVRRGLSTYHWKRPNAETVRFKDFHPDHIKALKPALRKADETVSPHIQLNLQVKMAKRGELERKYKKAYGHSARVGALSYTGKRKSKILMNPSAFERRAYYDPRGTFSHELGHVVQYANPGAMRSYNKTFAGTASKKTRQGVSGHEDFAESFRAAQGFNMTRKQRGYFQAALDQSRMDHLGKYYLK